MNFAALDVAIGLAFMYLLLSLLCTAINEWIATALQLRSKVLKESISRFLDSPLQTKARLFRAPEVSANTNTLYGHPLFTSSSRRQREPSYVAPKVFSSALLSAFGGAATLPEHAKRQVEALYAHPDITNEHAAVEEAFKEIEDRASGGYKRTLQILTILVGVVLVVAINADTIHAVHVLWRDPVLRAAIVQQAQERAKQPRPEPPRISVGYLDPQAPDPTATATSDDREEMDASRESTEGSVLTNAESAALGHLIGWGDDVRAFNAGYCADLQKKLNTACAGEITPECRKQLDALKTETRCVTVGTVLEPTTSYEGLGPGWLGVEAAHLPGWILTIVALSLGAPFWFDTLSLFMRVRGTGPKPDEGK